MSVLNRRNKSDPLRKHTTFIKTNTITLTYLCDLLHQFPVTIRTSYPAISLDTHIELFFSAALFFFVFASPYFCGWRILPSAKFNMHGAED